MDYTERDFAALAALGLVRDGQGIVLRETVEGRTLRAALTQGIPSDLPFIGLNIGCGTPDAENRRPSVPLLVEILGRLASSHPHRLLLTGAPNEQIINTDFLTQYATRWGDTKHIHDVAGKTTLSNLTGIITLCRIFISSDSGPYHMAVALAVPTLAIFNFSNPEAAHHHPMVGIAISGDISDIVAQAGNLFSHATMDGIQ
jgi:ADP-heptose:LPS heptosyltransferase